MKTKIIFLIAILAVCTTILFLNNQKKENVDEDMVSLEKYSKLENELKLSNKRIQILQEYIIDKNSEVNQTELPPQDPQSLLQILDQELTAAEIGVGTNGSFSDYFMPTMLTALRAGASNEAIEKRINKLIKLADDGVFLSSNLRDLYEEGGAKKVRERINQNLGWGS